MRNLEKFQDGVKHHQDSGNKKNIFCIDNESKTEDKDFLRGRGYKLINY